LVKSSVGSSWGTSGALATMRCPFRSKYFRKDARISLEVIGSIVVEATEVTEATGITRSNGEAE
jgi:hypothetical protein